MAENDDLTGPQPGMPPTPPYQPVRHHEFDLVVTDLSADQDSVIVREVGGRAFTLGGVIVTASGGEYEGGRVQWRCSQRDSPLPGSIVHVKIDVEEHHGRS